MKTILFYLLISLLIISFSFAQTDWIKYPGNPVLVCGSDGSWDDLEIPPAFIIYQDGTYRMWYNGINVYQPRNVGLATSSDGINWIKYSGNPVFTTGSDSSWDDFRVIMGSIIVKDNTYHMWYAGNDGTKGTYFYRANIGYATSTDSGVTWIKHPFPVLEGGSAGEWDDYSVNNPWVIMENDTFKMWFDGYRQTTANIGYAWSLDGINWTKYNDPETKDFPFRFSDPVLTTSPAWDNAYVFYPCVIKNNNQLEMWYSGFGHNVCKIGYAISSDGIIWKKFEGNPVMDVGPSGSWDCIDVFSTRVYLMNSVYKMWYAGYEGGYTNIGYATSTPTEVRDNLLELPSKLILNQNFPNPFNPSTTIKYQIANAGMVSLKVFDILSKEVKTLVNEYQPAEYYEVNFEASNLPSGVYFYQLRSGDFIQTKKMILLK
jgi:predicted GH43/DUF377 family glycosyl hydrolase